MTGKSSNRDHFMHSNTETPLMTYREAADLFRLSRSAVYQNVRNCAGFPQPIAIGRKAQRFVRAEVMAYLQRQRRNTDVLGDGLDSA